MNRHDAFAVASGAEGVAGVNTTASPMKSKRRFTWTQHHPQTIQR
jgi:hypothetical protein